MADTGRTVWADGLWADGFWAAGLWAGGGPTGPTITADPADTTVQDGAAASFSVSVVSSGGTETYQWQEDDGGGWADLAEAGIYSGTDTDQLAIDPADISMSGNLYRMKATDDNGATYSASAMLTVEGEPTGGATGSWSMRIRRILAARKLK